MRSGSSLVRDTTAAPLIPQRRAARRDVVRGETLDEVVDATTEHISSDHPDLAETVTRTGIESRAQLAP
jgi:hypothetical protein